MHGPQPQPAAGYKEWGSSTVLGRHDPLWPSSRKALDTVQRLQGQPARRAPIVIHVHRYWPSPTNQDTLPPTMRAYYHRSERKRCPASAPRAGERLARGKHGPSCIQTTNRLRLQTPKATATLLQAIPCLHTRACARYKLEGMHKPEVDGLRDKPSKPRTSDPGRCPQLLPRRSPVHDGSARWQ